MTTETGLSTTGFLPGRGGTGGQELTLAAILERAVARAAGLGLDPEAFFSASGDRPDRPRRRATARVSIHLLSRFLTWAAETSGDLSFGLKTGAGVCPRDLGAYGYLLLNAPTLGAAMELADRFADFPQQGHALNGRLAPDGHFEIRYDIHGLEERFRRQDAECTLAIAQAVLQSLVGRKLRPVEVRVQHGPVGEGSPLEEHFRCPAIHFDRDNALRYEASFLDLPIRGADPQLLSILVRHVEQELETLPPPGDEMGRIRWAIRRGLATGRMSVGSVARQCRLHERTLQRRLSRQGTSFSALVDSVRRDLLAECEASGPRSRRGMAELLGFCDASAFAKARRRWSRMEKAQATAPSRPATGSR